MTTYVESLTANTNDAMSQQMTEMDQAVSNHLATANADSMQQKEYMQNSINNEYTKVSTQFKKHCTETIDAAKLAATSEITVAINEAVTKEKAVALDKFEKLVIAAKAQLKDSKDNVLERVTMAIGDMTGTVREGVEEYHAVAMISIQDQLQSTKESIATELQRAVDQINEGVLESAKASLATRWNDAVKDINISVDRVPRRWLRTWLHQPQNY